MVVKSREGNSFFLIDASEVYFDRDVVEPEDKNYLKMYKQIKALSIVNKFDELYVLPDIDEETANRIIIEIFETGKVDISEYEELLTYDELINSLMAEKE